MNKMTKTVKESILASTTNKEVNFMGGVSFKPLNPVERLKMIAASSIFGEPSYYRNGSFNEKTVKDAIVKYKCKGLFDFFDEVLGLKDGETTTQIMEKAIDDALSYDFKATLEFAVQLRNDYFMRLNPQVIMVRASKHPNRAKFTEENPGLFNEFNQKVMFRADEPASQLAYYMFNSGVKGKDAKKNIPNILKKSWATRIENMSRYEMAKYKNAGLGLIDTVRVCHANSKLVDELMTTGKLEVSDDEKTWENLRSEGKSWREILKTTRLGHFALLKNLRNIFEEDFTIDEAKTILENLKKGVLGGKLFPFRYYTAYKELKGASGVNHLGLILDTLDECIDISCDNMPKLKGRTMCLSDNSGSAWGGYTTEYGTMEVAVIDNLSSLITARNSEEGYIGVFGDRLLTAPVSKRNGILTQMTEKGYGSRAIEDKVGLCTENGIWIFFKNAIEKKEHWDNIFIYSDQQAGHGGLYGTDSSKREYRKEYGCNMDDLTGQYYKEYINVLKLVEKYRREVNPKVNVFSVQTAGYGNSVVPEYAYRCNILTGWTGKELVFADEIIKQWDAHDASKKPTKKSAKNSNKQ